MPLETALNFLRSAGPGRRLPQVVVIFGPHSFLREYVFDSVVRSLIADGCRYRGFQIGAGDDYGVLLNELREHDMFAPKRAIACRILRSRREKADSTGIDADEGDARASAAGSGEPALVAAVEEAQGPDCLILLYEKDNAPAKIRRAAEKSALLINCMRPFDNQIEQYVRAFAQSLGLKMSGPAIDMIISRHGSDLAAIANALSKVTIFVESGASVQSDDLDEQGAKRMPEVFELAENLARGKASSTLAQLSRAIALGRDAFEILAVEIIPVMRRMMIAASMLAARKSVGDVSAALGFAPQSGMATRAIEGARRFGLNRLERAYWRACELDARFKNGLLKEREEALAGLLLDLMVTPD